MKNKNGLLLAIAFEILVLISLLFFAYVPLLFGEKVCFQARGYDPRDLFLGNYTQLIYENISEIETSNKYKKNELIYLSLVKKGDFYEGYKLSLNKPKEGLYLKGRVIVSWKIHKDKHKYKTRLNFGIERYYLPKDKALKLEKDLRKTKAKVHICILSGMARIESMELINQAP